MFGAVLFIIQKVEKQLKYLNGKELGCPLGDVYLRMHLLFSQGGKICH